ncbi:MAG: histidine kinase [Myxococcota bacterium]
MNASARRSFWTVQLVAWPLVTIVCLGHRASHDIKNELAPPAEAFGLLGLFAVLGFLGSSGLGRAYLALPDRWLEGERNRLTVLSLALSALLAASCAPVMYAAYASMSWQSPWFVGTVPYWSSLNFFVLFAAWSAIFHGVRYQSRFRRTQRRLLEAQALARDAQLAALRLQLNPHFFFNALNSVVGLVEVDPRQAQELMRRLAALMRRTLDSASFELVRLDEELDFVGQYVRCEQIRFRDKLDVTLEAPEALAAAPVPGMLLQPLVENAIKHGLRQGQTLRLHLDARGTTESITLEVRNTGTLAEDVREGTGLGLVRKRLGAQLPESGAFELVQEAEWVVARVRYTPAEATTERASLRRGRAPAIGAPTPAARPLRGA